MKKIWSARSKSSWHRKNDRKNNANDVCNKWMIVTGEVLLLVVVVGIILLIVVIVVLSLLVIVRIVAVRSLVPLLANVIDVAALLLRVFRLLDDDRVIAPPPPEAAPPVYRPFLVADPRDLLDDHDLLLPLQARAPLPLP